MRRIHCLVEGQTEEAIVNQVLVPYLGNDVTVTTSILVTKQPAAGGYSRGGVSTWAKVRGDLMRLLRNPAFDVLTTIIDYYGFPSDAPGMGTRPSSDPHQRVEHVEKALADDLSDPRFLPHLVLHETETWVLAGAQALAELAGDPSVGAQLGHQVTAAGGPEWVNDGPNTCPSKRILNAWPPYTKTLDGPIVDSDIGLDAVRASCPHADAWLARLTAGPYPPAGRTTIRVPPGR